MSLGGRTLTTKDKLGQRRNKRKGLRKSKNHMKVLARRVSVRQRIKRRK